MYRFRAGIHRQRSNRSVAWALNKLLNRVLGGGGYCILSRARPKMWRSTPNRVLRQKCPAAYTNGDVAKAGTVVAGKQ
jgi:hypothetical protein